MAHDPTLKIVVSAAPLPSIKQLRLDIDRLSQILTTSGTMIKVIAKVTSFDYKDALRNLKADISKDLSNITFDLSGNIGGKKGKSKIAESVFDVNELQQAGRDYGYAAKDIIEDIKKRQLKKSGVKSVESSTSSIFNDQGRYVKSFTVDVIKANGEVEKLNYKFAELKDSVNGDREGYVLNGVGDVDKSATSIAKLKKFISDQKEIVTQIRDNASGSISTESLKEVDVLYNQIIASISNLGKKNKAISVSQISDIKTLISNLKVMISEYQSLDEITARVSNLNTYKNTPDVVSQVVSQYRQDPNNKSVSSSVQYGEDSKYIKSFTVDVTKATGVVEKLYFALEKIRGQNGAVESVFVQSKSVVGESDTNAKMIADLDRAMESQRKYIEQQKQVADLIKSGSNGTHVGGLNQIDDAYNKVIDTINNLGNTNSEITLAQRQDVQNQLNDLKKLVAEYQKAENEMKRLSGAANPLSQTQILGDRASVAGVDKQVADMNKLNNSYALAKQLAIDLRSAMEAYHSSSNVGQQATNQDIYNKQLITTKALLNSIYSATAFVSKVESDIAGKGIDKGSIPQLEKVRQLLLEIKGMNPVDGTAYTQAASKVKELEAEMMKLKSSVDEAVSGANTGAALSSRSNAIENLRNKMESLYKASSKLRNSVEETEKYNNVMNQLNSVNLNSQESVNTMRGEVVKLTRSWKEGGFLAKTFGEYVGEAYKKFGGWMLVTRSLMSVVKVIKNMIVAVRELDLAMTELRKVTDETSSTYDKFLTNAAVRAKALGSTITDVVSATADFARLGYSLSDSESLADAAVLYKNVGDGIDNISESSSSIISTLKAFNVEAKNSISIVDKFNEVGEVYAR